MEPNRKQIENPSKTHGEIMEQLQKPIENKTNGKPGETIGNMYRNDEQIMEAERKQMGKNTKRMRNQSETGR